MYAIFNASRQHHAGDGGSGDAAKLLAKFEHLLLRLAQRMFDGRTVARRLFGKLRETCRHLCAGPLAAFAAWKLRTRSEAFRLHLLFACGVFLAFSEVYKQLFLYYIENNRHYDWWYFPFQLCSLPMYLCLLLPFVPHKYQRIFCTFMYNYNLLGAVMVFVDPSGLMHPYWTLTLHGFIWHILLIFIGLLIAFSRMVLPTAKGFWQSTAVFAVGCVIATIINVTSHPYGNADMFYITPYYATTQIVYSQIAAKFGIFAGNAVYVLSIILGAWLLHLVYEILSHRTCH